MARPVSVSDLTSTIRELLEGSQLLQNLWVCGEISNYKAHSSGHCYLTLKDERASLRAVIWRSKAAVLRIKPVDGMKVFARGTIGVYERDGNYQFYIDQLEPDGLGSLYAQFEQLKAKLGAEGLFSQTRKRALPQYPRTIAVLTSPTGAAVRDIISVLRRRYPLAQVLLFPVLVQGPEAAATLVSALKGICEHKEVDVAIVGRGGGSIEDLWAFNDEQVARAIAECACPVVSAVGHETDFTIADLVADLRAPTPSAAAELVVPDTQEILRNISGLDARMQRAIERKCRSTRQYLDNLALRLHGSSPVLKLKEHRQRAIDLSRRISLAMSRRLTNKRASIAEKAGRLEALSPLKVLARGFSVTRSNGKILKFAHEVREGDSIVTELHMGNIVSVVIGKGETDDLRRNPARARENSC